MTRHEEQLADAVIDYADKLKAQRVRYSAGYNYQLQDTIRVPMAAPDVQRSRECPFVEVRGGWLYIFAGYAWDGASGAVDTPNMMIASCIHDAVCQLTDLGLLDYDTWRPWGDRELVRIAKATALARAEEMGRLRGAIYRTASASRRAWVYAAVRWYSGRNKRRGPKPSKRDRSVLVGGVEVDP